ncbi:SAM-dependent methyltransferase [Nocardia sp. NBC_01388]|uniref:SAM-dependent methyltransferase n=1 Tax=Nocardia sp. NBC_01388 TaxID=2903596 RepID=UPI003247D3CA
MTKTKSGPVAGPSGSLPSGVSLTAVGIAVGRAMETVREDRLFSDPFAQAFVDAIDEAPVGRMREFAGYVAVRTRYFDDRLLAARVRGCSQIVLLAAGLDARAFRLNWPAGTHVFELDLPDLLRFKRRVLEGLGAVPTSDEHAVVEADLRQPWYAPLAAAGFDPSRPTAWLVEGLLPYLTRAENDALLAEIARISVPGSEIALDHLNVSSRQRHSTTMAETLVGIDAQWQDAVDDSAPWAWLTAWGWEVVDSPLIGELAGRYGRGAQLSPEIAAQPSGVVHARRAM